MLARIRQCEVCAKPQSNTGQRTQRSSGGGGFPKTVVFVACSDDKGCILEFTLGPGHTISGKSSLVTYYKPDYWINVFWSAKFFMQSKDLFSWDSGDEACILPPSLVGPRGPVCSYLTFHVLGYCKCKQSLSIAVLRA